MKVAFVLLTVVAAAYTQQAALELHPVESQGINGDFYGSNGGISAQSQVPASQYLNENQEFYPQGQQNQGVYPQSQQNQGDYLQSQQNQGVYPQSQQNQGVYPQSQQNQGVLPQTQRRPSGSFSSNIGGQPQLHSGLTNGAGRGVGADRLAGSETIGNYEAAPESGIGALNGDSRGQGRVPPSRLGDENQGAARPQRKRRPSGRLSNGERRPTVGYPGNNGRRPNGVAPGTGADRVVGSEITGNRQVGPAGRLGARNEGITGQRGGPPSRDGPAPEQTGQPGIFGRLFGRVVDGVRHIQALHNNARLGRPGSGYNSDENDVFSRENDLFSRENDVFSRENDLFSREDDVYSRENDLYSNERDVYSNEDDLYSREDDLYSREDDLYSREKDLFSRENDLQSRENDLYSREDPFSREASYERIPGRSNQPLGINPTYGSDVSGVNPPLVAPAGDAAVAY